MTKSELFIEVTGNIDKYGCLLIMVYDLYSERSYVSGLDLCSRLWIRIVHGLASKSD